MNSPMPAKSMISSSEASICLRDRPRIDAVEVDVLPAGELGVEAGAELEQGGHPAGGGDRAARRPDDAGHAA